MEELREVKAALRRMIETRFCPPFTKLTEDHLRICPYCREMALEGEEDIPVLPVLPRPSLIEVGQLWRTAEELAGYDEEFRYHNPIAVLVIEKIDERTVRVAPVHPEETLAWAGDVEIDKGLYVEIWNTFPFPVKYLEKYLGTFEVPVYNNTEPAAPPPTPQHAFFRKIEAEVAATLVFKTWNEILGEYTEDVADVIVDMAEDIVIEGRYPKNISDILDRLALSEPADDSYDMPLGMAATDSTEDFRIIPVNVAHLAALRVYVRTIPGKITFWNEKDDSLEIGGHVSGNFSPDAGIHAVWKHKETGGVLAHALLASFDPESGFFRIVFSGLSEEVRGSGELALLICTR